MSKQFPTTSQRNLVLLDVKTLIAILTIFIASAQADNGNDGFPNLRVTAGPVKYLGLAPKWVAPHGFSA